jgi:mono/diheme cytochrome c family protein
MICAFFALAACTAARADDRTPKNRFAHDMMVRFHMHENFDLLRAIEKLLVHGKLEEARSLARSIAQAPDEPGLAAFAGPAAAVREQASALAGAGSLDDALRGEARLAQACADCHVAAGVVPELREPPSAPPDQPTVEARMTRHLWATDRLWEGIVAQSDDAWRAGLDVLAATPLPGTSSDAVRAKLARQLQRMATTAKQDQAGDRARSYGEILATCAACHTAPAGPARPTR